MIFGLVVNWRAALTHPKALDRLNYETKGENNARIRTPSSQHYGGRKACWSSKMGLGKMTSKSIIHTNMHKPNNKLVSEYLEHF